MLLQNFDKQYQMENKNCVWNVWFSCFKRYLYAKEEKTKQNPQQKAFMWLTTDYRESNTIQPLPQWDMI